jgi:hypothetical protein
VTQTPAAGRYFARWTDATFRQGVESKSAEAFPAPSDHHRHLRRRRKQQTFNIQARSRWLMSAPRSVETARSRHFPHGTAPTDARTTRKLILAPIRRRHGVADRHHA